MRSGDRCPGIVELTSDRAKEHGVAPAPRIGKRRHLNRVGDGQAALASPVGRFEVLEDGAAGQPDERDVGAGFAKQVELAGARRLGVDPDQRPDKEAKPGEGERAIRHGAAEPPAARVVRRDVP